MVKDEAKIMIGVALIDTNRDGIRDLLQHMEDIGFYDAPCSSGNHLSQEGGLAEHSLNVMLTAEKLSMGLLGFDGITKEMRDSIVICSVLHDLGKCGDFEKPLYVDNLLKSGKTSQSKPYQRNKDLTNVPHSIRSIKIASKFINLTEDEEWAILTHDGMYDYLKYEMQGKETPLSLIIHWADMWSARVIERTVEEDV